MIYSFPSNVRIRNVRARVEGLRLGTFTNIDNEAFARPALNGFWRVEMTLLSHDEDSYLALTAFMAEMRGQARTVLPLTTRWLPNDENGRKLSINREAPAFGMDHMGFASDPFPGFTLRSPASHRNSYIDVNKPELSHLRPGHRFSIADRMYQVTKASAINESDTASRISIKPPIRGNHDAGSLVQVDDLRLLAQMESADDPEDWNIAHAEVKATFIEAF